MGLVSGAPAEGADCQLRPAAPLSVLPALREFRLDDLVADRAGYGRGEAGVSLLVSRSSHEVRHVVTQSKVALQRKWKCDQPVLTVRHLESTVPDADSPSDWSIKISRWFPTIIRVSDLPVNPLPLFCGDSPRIVSRFVILLKENSHACGIVIVKR